MSEQPFDAPTLERIKSAKRRRVEKKRSDEGSDPKPKFLVVGNGFPLDAAAEGLFLARDIDARTLSEAEQVPVLCVKIERPTSGADKPICFVEVVVM